MIITMITVIITKISGSAIMSAAVSIVICELTNNPVEIFEVAYIFKKEKKKKVHQWVNKVSTNQSVILTIKTTFFIGR